MRAPLLAAADFLAAFQKLMPRGEVWPQDGDAVQTQALSGLVPTTTRQAARAANLLTDAFPATAIELLPEWEETLGLPDPCLGANPLIEARQASVVARLAAHGGQSVPYYQNLAITLGGSIEIIEYAPARFGISHFGDLFWPAAAASWWTVQINGSVLYHADFGTATFGQPFWQLQQEPIQCEIERLAPAHTLPFFQT